MSTDTVAVARRIQRQTGPTFHIATRLLPERVRHPTYVLYAYFRLADQVVDDPDPVPPERQRALLDRYERAARGDIETDNQVLSAMASLVDDHGIDPDEITAFIDAMRRDIDTQEYETYGELEGYLRGSAVAVAYMMLAVMDPDDAPTARPHARALGEAFQLTNFLRDVREDVVDFDRLYLPTTTLEAHGIDAEAVRDLEYSPAFADAMASELERTESRYRTGVAGIRLLPDDCQFAVLLSAVLYAEYHRKIVELEFDVLTVPPSFDRWEYLSLVTRTWIAWRRSGDPETVFYAVSPIEPHPKTPTTQSRKRRWSEPIERINTALRTTLSPLRGD